MTEQKETGLFHKLGYTVAQMMEVLFWAFFFYMIWQLLVFLGAPSVSFAVFVLVEVICRFIMQHLVKSGG